ncbi:MAG: 2-phospho-L-lactate transferase [Nitrososphaerales archaeon]
MITVLAGGTGSAKLVRGFNTQEKELAVICNVGDNIWLHGLYICPDIDTVVYALAGMLDLKKGWGIKHDSFEFIRQLEILGEESWFNIGDKDLATHLVRTKMLKEGKGLYEITQWMCSRFGVYAKIIPVTESHVETRIGTEEEEMHLQEFWVKRRATGKIRKITYHGASKTKPIPEAMEAIRSSSMVVIAPGNPITSIAPILAIKGMSEFLTRMRKKCVAVSPIVGNKPVSGPAAKYMESAGVEVSPYGVAKFYSDIISKFIIHTSDKQYAAKIEGLGIKTYDTNIIMNDASDEARLASYILRLQKSVLH